MKLSSSFTIIELIMVIVIIGIISTIAIPKFINMRKEARTAANEANIGALRSAALTYYAKTGLERFAYLCTAAGNGYRSEDTEAPCYPANISELEGLLVSPPDWGQGEGGSCYDSSSGVIISCE